jgi:AcrR family transcriptional regulator
LAKPLSRKEREKIQRRNEIIDAAEKRFFQKGYENVSMDEIAQDLELSKPTLYLYFENKDALFLEVTVRGMTLLKDEFEAAVAHEKTGKAKTTAFIHAFLNYGRKHPDFYNLLMETRTSIKHKLKNLKLEGARRFDELSLATMTLLRDSITLGVKDGTLRQNLEPLQTVVFIITACEAVLQRTPELEYLVRNNVSLEQYLEYSVEVIMRGIAAKE